MRAAVSFRYFCVSVISSFFSCFSFSNVSNNGNNNSNATVLPTKQIIQPEIEFNLHTLIYKIHNRDTIMYNTFLDDIQPENVNNKFHES